jgi:antitoxin component YwqK of YwqJK toxin-antitoxin module
MLKRFIQNIPLTIFVLSGLISFVSCGKADQEGMTEWENKEKGVKAWERASKNGITTYTYYYKSGIKKRSEEYSDGIRHGKSIQWHENGKVEFEKEFDTGKKTGTHKRYYDNGKLSGEQFYDMGIKSGTWKFYLISGKEWISESYNKGSLISSERINVFGLK